MPGQWGLASPVFATLDSLAQTTSVYFPGWLFIWLVGIELASSCFHDELFIGKVVGYGWSSERMYIIDMRKDISRTQGFRSWKYERFPGSGLQEWQPSPGQVCMYKDLSFLVPDDYKQRVLTYSDLANPLPPPPSYICNKLLGGHSPHFSVHVPVFLHFLSSSGVDPKAVQAIALHCFLSLFQISNLSYHKLVWVSLFPSSSWSYKVSSSFWSLASCPCVLMS